ncbi:MAG: hypothetical protein KDC87_03720 [Planctomycetes bacterium]|nr:hypothetical protein [Planctomycetota bacterium]
MMGRIAAIDALGSDYRVVVVGSASGGVFVSDNAGVTWRAVFDRYGSGSIGAVALDQQNPDVLWVGTGEAANRNSSGWGDGVYRSTDGGKSFVHCGLADTHHIAAIALHPTDKDTAWVAALGHLWGYSGSRGLYKTTDGGKTFAKLTHGLPDDGKTGCTEVVVHPRDPNTLYCGMYHRLRGPASMHSGGAAGGVFQSKDGGATWHKLTVGLPVGATGMIDIAIHHANPDIVVANIEADEKLPADLSVPGPGVYRSDDGGATWRYLLRHNTRPYYHGQIAIDPLDPKRIYVVSRDFRVTTDGGKTWRAKWWGGGGDDHDMWISPQDPRVFYNATDQGAYLTVDDGRTLTAFDNMAIGQYYAIGVDMRDPYHVVGGLQDNGIWSGPSRTREPRGILNMHNTWLGEGDGFHSLVDPTDWRTAYFVNHVGFAARLDVVTRRHTFITPTPETVVNFSAWFDPARKDPPIRYTIAPGEHWFFGRNPRRPKLPPQFRFNWSSPLVMSPSNPRRLYFGGNHLFRSVDRGDTWRIVSPDLTTDDPALRNPSDQGGLTRDVTGGENHCTIVTIAESPLDPALVWVGTDDGNVQVTRDGGASWRNVRPQLRGVPDKTWVSRVCPSHHDRGTCVVSFDNHRRDDMRPYLAVTEDYGKSWQLVGGGLPENGSVYVVREDPINRDLWFVGTEFGAFASLDRGHSFTRLAQGLPTVAVHDLVIHPRDGDLVAGTHGRSIWILDDITALQQLAPRLRQAPLHLFRSRTATLWRRVPLGRKQPNSLFHGENPPSGALIHFLLGGTSAKRVTVTVEDAAGTHAWSTAVEAQPGITRIEWPLRFPSSDPERAAQRELLAWVVTELRARVGDGAPQRDLADLAARLGERAGDQALNEIRGALVARYAPYASRRGFFGRPIGPRAAAAGTYRVTVVAGDQRCVGELQVRDDPLR